MVDRTITDLAAASTIIGDELVEISQLSTTVKITAATISALASDNSYNDSGSGFVAAGFAVNDRVTVTGFTGNAANNIFVGKITALTAGKMTIGGTDGDVIVDDAAGESVTITKWVTRRTPLPGRWRLAGGAYASAGIWDQSADGSVATVDFTGLAGCTDILIVMDAVTKSVSGTPLVRASDDNGASWESGYSFQDTAGVRTTNSNIGEMHATAATAARDAIFKIHSANGPRAVGIAVTAGVSHRIFTGQTAPINAVQIRPSGGGNFTGGKFYCLVR